MVILVRDKVCAFVSSAFLWKEKTVKTAKLKIPVLRFDGPLKPGIATLTKPRTQQRIERAAKAVSLSPEEFVKQTLDASIKSALEG